MANGGGATLAGSDLPGDTPPVACNSALLSSEAGSPGAGVLLVPELREVAAASCTGDPVKVPVGCLAEATSVGAADVAAGGEACGDFAEVALRLARRRASRAEATAPALLPAGPLVSTGSPDAAPTAFSCVCSTSSTDSSPGCSSPSSSS